MLKPSLTSLSNRRRIISSLLIGFIFLFLLKEGSQFIYKSKPESRVVNTGSYYLSKFGLSTWHDSDSFLFPYHLHLMQLDLSSENFKRYCLFLLHLSSLILISYTAYRRDLFAASFISVFLLLSPIYLIQITWIGFPDHLNFLFLTLLILSLDASITKAKWNWTILPLFILGSWNHFYQFNVSASLVLLTFFALNKRINYKIIFFAFSGAFLGRISALFLFHLQDVEILNRRENVILAMKIDSWIKMHTSHIMLTLLSFFNGLIILFLENLLRKYFIMLIIFFLAICVTFFTSDTTRVFVNLFYPSWILFWLHRSKTGFKKNEKFLLAALLIAAAIYTLSFDLFYKWGGKIIYLMR